MANLKEIRNRIVSVNSTQQITKAMKMVAAAKLRRSQDAITQMRPYAQKLTQMLETVSAGAEQAQHNPYRQVREVQRVLVVVVTSDRGLAGAFNANIVKAAMGLVQEKYGRQFSGQNVEILSIGKKGGEALNRRGYTVVNTYEDTFTKLSFDQVRKAAEYIMKAYTDGRFDAVELVFNEFKNVATQIVRVETFLPLAESSPDSTRAVNDYIFEP